MLWILRNRFLISFLCSSDAFSKASFPKNEVTCLPSLLYWSENTSKGIHDIQWRSFSTFSLRSIRYFSLLKWCWSWIELNLLFNVTINDISVIYVTAHRCAGGRKKKLDLRSGSQRHRHFAGFFNVPVLAPTRDHPFYTVIPTHRPI